MGFDPRSQLREGADLLVREAGFVCVPGRFDPSCRRPRWPDDYLLVAQMPFEELAGDCIDDEVVGADGAGDDRLSSPGLASITA